MLKNDKGREIVEFPSTRLRFYEISTRLISTLECYKWVIGVHHCNNIWWKKAPNHRNIYITSLTCKCMQMHAKPDTDLSPPDARAVNIQIFGVLTISCFAGCQKHSHFFFFLINMQMRGIRFVCWIELIPAAPPACTIIRNYRQASDGRLKPWILSGGLLPQGRNPNQANWSDRKRRHPHSNVAYLLSVSKEY